MQISYSHRFIFFHVAKVAGLSIRDALDEYTEEPKKFKIKQPPKLSKGKPNPMYDIWQVLLLHATARDAKRHLPNDVFEGFYKFAFVRNPWDWHVSMYHFILKEKQHVHHQVVRDFGAFGEEYLQWVIDTKRPFARGATKFQYEMVADRDGDLIVDYIGRFETLTQDFNTVCQHLNLNTSLPHLNGTKHRTYHTYYNDISRQMVAEYFERDIALFGYSFDDAMELAHV